jgi:hypothetical protein
MSIHHHTNHIIFYFTLRISMTYYEDELAPIWNKVSFLKIGFYL